MIKDICDNISNDNALHFQSPKPKHDNGRSSHSCKVWLHWNRLFLNFNSHIIL